MTATPPPKDSRIGKGYSYLFAIALTAILVSQSIGIKFQTNSKREFNISIESRELNAQLFTAGVGLIATILGLPTDAIALAIGKFLSKEP
ncbi:hypothetical protein [Anabaena sp. CCY 9910]|uniref:hypothetical protein n=1 Tax=Anabaena sp. CCY 9910 TaxID=3103870 RepID=UPI0039E11EA1